MKTSEIVNKVEELISLLPSNSQNGVFGFIVALRNSRVKLRTKIPASENLLTWEPEDFKPIFQIEHEMNNKLFQDPLLFSIGRKEIWISTWYFTGAGKRSDVECHPFVLSWNKFL